MKVFYYNFLTFLYHFTTVVYAQTFPVIIYSFSQWHFFILTAAIAVGNAHFGQGNGTIWLDDVSCTGREANISECRHPEFGIQNCAHNQDAGVQCQAGITVGCSFDM